MQEKDYDDTTTTIDDEVTTAAPAIPEQQLIDPFALYLRNEGGGGGFFAGDYLNFNGQTGAWTRNKEPIGATVPFICNMHEICIGWIKFVKDGKPIHEIGRIIDGYQRLPRAALGDTDEEDWGVNSRGEPQDPWKEVTYLPMKCLEDDEPVVYGPFSFTARKAVADFVAVYRRADRAGRFPVVRLESRSFQNKSGGITYVPELKIVGWEYWDDVPAPEVQPIVPPSLPPSPVAAARPALVAPKAITGARRHGRRNPVCSGFLRRQRCRLACRRRQHPDRLTHEVRSRGATPGFSAFRSCGDHRQCKTTRTITIPPGATSTRTRWRWS
jgi:hypothetical protein